MLVPVAARNLLSLFLVVAAIAACSRASSDNAERRSPPTPPCQPVPLEDRAARVLVAGLAGVTDPSHPLVQELTELHVGGVFITDSNVQSMTQVSELVNGIRSRAGGPLIVSTDEESGRVSTFAAVLGQGPSPRRLAAQHTPAEVRNAARELGAQLAGVGIDVDLAPVADLDDGPWNGAIGDRSFSGDPLTAFRYALSYAQGLADARVTPVVKHFPGQGRARQDAHHRLPAVDAPLEDLKAADLAPFADLIAAGAPVVMTSHVAYAAIEADLPASLSPNVYRLLREMGFRGVAMTDSVGMGAVNRRWNFPDSAVLALGAGADAVLTTDGTQARQMRDAIVGAVRTGSLPEARVDEAAGRVFALAGGDPMSLTCRRAVLPELDMAPVS